MIRFFFYPQWNYRKAEVWLEQMENNGYRLVDVYFFWWFRFVKSSPKQTRYLFTYNFLKETYMMDIEHALKDAKYRAQCIAPNRLFSVTIFRILNVEADLTEIESLRQKYLKHVVCQKLLLSCFFFLSGFIASFFPLDNLFEYILSSVIITVTLPYTLWLIYGLWCLSKKSNE